MNLSPRRLISLIFPLALSVGSSLFVARAGEAAQLYSNGPLASVPGGGAGGADASRLQTSLGMTTLGFNVDIISGSSSIRAVADDFTVPAPGWNITRITVFGYQTDSGIVSTLTDLRLLIFNGPPDSPASAPIYGNPAVNMLASTGFTNVFRDEQASPGGSRRPIMSASANVNVFLPPGTYWLVWALAGGVASGPFVPPITIAGQTTTGNGLHLCTCTGWSPARDTGTSAQQGFPFVIEGDVAGGGTPASLSVSANTTTLRTGNRFVLSATLAGGGPARYDAYILIDVPGGGVLSVTPGGPVPGLVPYARGFTAFPISAVLLDIIVPPAPVGTYAVRAFLAATGTTTPATPVSQFAFSIVP